MSLVFLTPRPLRSVVQYSLKSHWKRWQVSVTIVRPRLIQTHKSPISDGYIRMYDVAAAHGGDEYGRRRIYEE